MDSIVHFQRNSLLNGYARVTKRALENLGFRQTFFK